MKKFLVLFALLAAVTIAAYFVFGTAGCNQNKKIETLEARISELKNEYVPLRFKVLDRKNESLRVALKFYDADTKVIDRTTKMLSGKELSIDFYVIPVSDRYLAFPNKIFTDKIPPAEGENLTQYYDKAGFPQIYYSKKLNNKLVGGLASVFERVKRDDFAADDKYFGNMVHDITDLQSYKTGSVYRVVCRTKGGIEVVEE